MLAAPAAAHAATLDATPLTLASTFSSAQPGNTIRLASGDYGTFTGGKKSGITIAPESGATPQLKASFASATNITLDGLKLSGLSISGTGTKNITVRNSDFPGAQAVIKTSDVVNANVVLDHDRFVIGGESDGIQDGGNGVRIVGNEFANLVDNPDLGVHVDALQLYGSSHTVIQGNWFHSVPNGVVAFDGADPRGHREQRH